MSALLEVEGLGVDYDTVRGPLRAVDGVGFAVARGETVAIVGESGSGKSTVAHALMRLIPRASGRIAQGVVRFDGVDLVGLAEPEMRAMRGRRIGMVFQDPMMGLNPVHRIGRQIAEALIEHGIVPPRAAMDRAIELLALVGVPAPAERVRQFPHNLSGGMRQRVMIAMALAGNPALLVADEPTTALDVTVQAQVLALIDGLKARLGMAVLLITHDLAVVSEVADRIVVMYAGRKVEEGRVEAIFATPAHPYTRGLLGASDWDGEPGERLREIPGTVPPLDRMPRGCAFAPRCPVAQERCHAARPTDLPAAHGGRVACFVAATGAA
ncbi:MAG: ABC transporter ATP-binding protein [Alphaproteobacteria bacterium]|nr:ABC transporter ATP-binding protein [Alphaproteobacteria bacterium]